MIESTNLLLLCATERGLACLKTIRDIQPHLPISVVSFREEPWEPPFIDAIQEYCSRAGCKFFESRRVEDIREIRERLVHFPSLLLAVSWRYLVPPDIFCKPSQGSYLFHDSLLPKYRGFSPTVWAIVNGDNCTGATLLRMDQEMDAGEIIDQTSVVIEDNETIKDVLPKVTNAYQSIIRRNLIPLLKGNVTGRSQNENLATFCCKRLPTDNRINWHKPTNEIHNLIRATTRPYSGAFTYHNGALLKVWSSKRILEQKRYVGAIPGRVIAVKPGVGTTILTGDGALMVCEIEDESRNLVNASCILNRLSITLD